MGKRTIARGTPDSNVPVKHQLVQLFWMLCPAFIRWAESHMQQKGMTPQRIQLLGLLLENGPMMMRQLRDRLGVTATNITALVDVLEKDGFVRRKPHATDRRATLIHLTAKAEQRMEEGCREFKESVSELFSDLSAAEQRDLQRLLERMRSSLVERKILQESDYCARAQK